MNPFRDAPARPARFSTAGDAELCHDLGRTFAARYVAALGAIIALHRASLEHEDDDTCHICIERWPCPTVQIALRSNREDGTW